MSNPLAQYPIGILRAWADKGVISQTMYSEEVWRRRKAAFAEISDAILSCAHDPGGDELVDLDIDELFPDSVPDEMPA